LRIIPMRTSSASKLVSGDCVFMVVFLSFTPLERVY
jgi:hypothetical protein